MRTLKLNVAVAGEKEQIDSLEEIEELVGRLGPEFPYFSLTDPDKVFVQAAHYPTAATGPNVDENAAEFVLEYSEATGIVHQTFTDDATEIISFMRRWANDEEGWKSSIEEWKVLNLNSCLILGEDGQPLRPNQST